MESNVNTLIERHPYINDLNRYHGQMTIALHRDDDRTVSGSEFIRYFESEPYGETDIYKWDTKRADEIVNLHIWKVR